MKEFKRTRYDSLFARQKRAKVVDIEQRRITDRIGFDKCGKCGTQYRGKVLECRECGNRV